MDTTNITHIYVIKTRDDSDGELEDAAYLRTPEEVEDYLKQMISLDPAWREWSENTLDLPIEVSITRVKLGAQ